MKSPMCAAVAAAAVLGCAAKPDTRPLARTVCMVAQQESPEETAYLVKRAAAQLHEAGYQLGTENCDVTATYSRFGQFQGEAVKVQPFWISRNGYWSQEGMVTTRDAKGKILDEDRSIALRGYSTKQELIDTLSWQIVAPATWYFRPPTPQN